MAAASGLCDISPYLLIAALSCAAVISQIQSKRFTQDIIDSIGSRIKELVLPIPKDKKKEKKLKTSLRNQFMIGLKLENWQEKQN